MPTIDRIEKLRGLLAKNKIDAIFVSRQENRYYLSGFDGSDGFLLITPDKAVLATDFRYTEQAGLQAPDYEVHRISGGLSTWFPGLVGDLRIKRLGFEAASVTVALHGQLKNSLKQQGVAAKLVPVSGLVEELRTVKEPAEIDFIRRAAAISDAAMEDFARLLEPGLTELQAAWELEKHMRQAGSQAMPFEIIVAAGPNAARPHAQPSDYKIKAGDPVVIDMGAKVSGYASDMTRTICAGNKPDGTFRKVYGTVLDAQTAAMTIIREGTTGGQADGIARAIIDEAGYGQAFGHALGHGVGLAVHEAPRLGPGSADALTTGMVFTVEPGIYLPGWGGVRIEDTVTLVAGQAEAISKAGKVRYD